MVGPAQQTAHLLFVSKCPQEANVVGCNCKSQLHWRMTPCPEERRNHNNIRPLLTEDALQEQGTRQETQV